MNKLLKVNRLVGRYLLFASPLVVCLLVWSAFSYTGQGGAAPRFSHGVVQFLWDVFGIHFLLWLLALGYFFFALLFSSSLREALLTKAARIKERDEREEFIVGRAAKASWLSTLALMILLLLFSGLHVRVAQQEGQPKGKNRSVSIGYGFSLLQRTTRSSTPPKGKTLFAFTGIALSQSTILLILLFWHIFSFHLFARKWAKK